jgi:hypothetical protein
MNARWPLAGCDRLLEPAPVTIGPAPRGAGVRKVCCLTRAAQLPDALGLRPARCPSGGCVIPTVPDPHVALPSFPTTTCDALAGMRGICTVTTIPVKQNVGSRMSVLFDCMCCHADTAQASALESTFAFLSPLPMGADIEDWLRTRPLCAQAGRRPLPGSAFLRRDPHAEATSSAPLARQTTTAPLGTSCTTIPQSQ